MKAAPANIQTEITGLTCDSRKVMPGVLFAALPGSRADGRAFLKEAAANGAAALLVPQDLHEDEMPPGDLPLIAVDNPRRHYALLAARLFSRQPEVTVAVTGTNGKTSVAAFTRRIWETLGHRAASLGTMGVQADGYDRPGGLTTPDSADLHRELQHLAELGIDRLAMEASSHGLHQHRLDGVRLAAAGFTNLSRDHLDYHGDLPSYLAAKRRLFADLLAEDGIAVLNADVPEFEVLGDTGRRCLSYGFEGNELCLLKSTPEPGGQRLELDVLGHRRVVRLPLAGGFQAANALCALGLTIATGADAGRATEALAGLQGVPGRLEHVGGGVYVDYAHTPDALATVLDALRPHAAGRLGVVFGCGGDRDPGKRPLMGRIAYEKADHVLVTDDNPRTEDAASIRLQILAACPGGIEIGDRSEAIARGIAWMQTGDILLIAGKGHETGQLIGDAVLPFDDRKTARVLRQGGGS